MVLETIVCLKVLQNACIEKYHNWRKSLIGHAFFGGKGGGL